MAILYSEEQGQAEKFRPYGVPSEAWLGWVEERLASRAVSAPPATAMEVK